MRLRQSNKRKSFRPSDIIPRFGSDDEESLGEAEAGQISTQNGIVDAAAAVGDSDGSVAAVGDDGDVYDEEDDALEVRYERDELDEDAKQDGNHVNAELSEEEEEEQQQPARKPKPRPVAARIGDVQSYPTDPSARWTRAYIGPVQRWTRFHDLSWYWFSDRDDYEQHLQFIISTWANYELLPPRLESADKRQKSRNPWMQETFASEQETKFLQWYAYYLGSCSKRQISVPLPKMTATRWYLPQTDSELTALLGRYNEQKEYKFTQKQSIPLSEYGFPMEGPEDDGERGGWLLDVGGMVMSMGWAPTKGMVDQLLAMTVIPFSDQAYHETPEQAPTESSKKQSSIQIWRISIRTDMRGRSCFGAAQPQLVTALCYEWGRALRMQWCPVPLRSPGQVGLLGLLCSDGKARVLEVKAPPARIKADGGVFEEIQEPLATLELKDEYRVEITCFTWINTNRIAVGHSDGSVAVWSLYPCRLLQRHPVHASPIIDITSSYPSHPFIVATMPVGGVATVTDLGRPNEEMVYHTNLAVTFQPNLLSWNEHVRGYICIWPTTHPGNNFIAYMAARVFSQARFLLYVDGQPSCLATGSCHPFTLVGSTDGSLWIVNHFRKVTFYRKKVYKLRLWQHEYRPLPSAEGMEEEDEQDAPRGACRIIQGFAPEDNSHPKAALYANPRKDKKKKGKNKSSQKPDATEANGAGAEAEPGYDTGDPSVYDPLTRITAVNWNPNAEFGWWAAAAMGSGLVRIMDLGIDQGMEHGVRMEHMRGRRRTKQGEGSDDPEEEEEEEEEEAELTDGADTDEDVVMTGSG